MARTLMAHMPWLARTNIMARSHLGWILPTTTCRDYLGWIMPKTTCRESLQVVLGIIHPRWLELPLARTIVHCPKPVRATEVLL